MCACKYGTYKEMKKNKINVSIVLLIADTTNSKKKKRKKKTLQVEQKHALRILTGWQADYSSSWSFTMTCLSLFRPRTARLTSCSVKQRSKSHSRE